MIYGANRYVKHYVSVLVLHRVDGCLVPVSILWDDGRRFDVELLRDGTQKRCEKTPGYALAFHVAIKGKPRYLYKDAAGWFVETIEGAHTVRSDPRMYQIPE